VVHLKALAGDAGDRQRVSCDRSYRQAVSGGAVETGRGSCRRSGAWAPVACVRPRFGIARGDDGAAGGLPNCPVCHRPPQLFANFLRGLPDAIHRPKEDALDR